MKTKVERLQENNLKLRRQIAQQAVSASLAERRYQLLLEVIAKLNVRLEVIEEGLTFERFFTEQSALGRRVTVSVEVYDTKGTSKRGHAATFAEAVEQVNAMMEKSE